MDFGTKNPTFSFEESEYTQLALSVSSTHSDGLKIELQTSLKSCQSEENSYDNTHKLVCEFEDCEKTFSQASALQKHDKMHRREKSYACQICGHTFTQASNLKRHEKLHTGEKPYACDQCDKAFSTISNLKQHQQIHESTEERAKFECTKCQKTYFYQSSLNKHMKSHEKKDTKAAKEKESQSMSPSKNRTGAPKEIITKWDSSPSDDQYSDISPTIKKVKKEKATTSQMNQSTTPETSITSNASSSINNNKLEQEFIMHYNKSLTKVLDQTHNSSEDSPLKSILSLQYLTISDFQSTLPVNSNSYTNPLVNHDSGLFNGLELNLTSKPEEYSTAFQANHQHEGIAISQPEKQTVETFEEYQPIFSFLEQDLFPQKLLLSSEQYLDNIPAEFCIQDSSVVPIEKAKSSTTNDTNQAMMNLEFDSGCLEQKTLQEANDMIDYELEKLRENVGRKISLESEFGASDKWHSFGLQREVSESHNFMRDFLDSAPFESLS